MQTYVRPMLWVFLTGLLAGCQSAGDGIDARAIRQYSIDDFLGSTSLRGASFSPDNSKILVSSDQTGVFNAYAILLDGSEPVQLTESTTDAILVESYFPRDERFIYLADQGGNELDHVYVRELDGTIIDITPGEGHKADFLDWAYDRTSFFITTNERDSHYFDIYEVATDVQGGNFDHFAYRAYAPGSPLPWDHLRAGASPAALENQWRKASSGGVVEAAA